LDFVGAVAAAFTPLDEGVDPISISGAAENPTKPDCSISASTPQLLGVGLHYRPYEVLDLTATARTMSEDTPGTDQCGLSATWCTI